MNEVKEFLICQIENKFICIDVMRDAELLWLNQKQLTELFGKAKGTISEHLKHIFEEGEHDESSVVRYFRTTAADGKQYEVAHYNLDMILGLGFRKRSSMGVKYFQFDTQHCSPMKTVRSGCLTPAPIPTFPQRGKGPDIALSDTLPLWGRAGVGVLSGFFDPARQDPQRAQVSP